MKYGIVGSRKRQDKQSVVDFVNSLDDNDIIISGGCKGVDTWAEEAARKRGLGVIVFLPDLKGCKKKYEFTERYYARNKRIADESDILIAFVDESRKGGTENTIKYMEKAGKQVILK